MICSIMEVPEIHSSSKVYMRIHSHAEQVISVLISEYYTRYKIPQKYISA